jgi:20S proteasome alpha/beta subunit
VMERSGISRGPAWSSANRRHVEAVYVSWAVYLVIVTFLLALSGSFASSSSSGPPSDAALLSPIENFGASWAASSVQGTTIAIPVKLKESGNGEDDRSCDAVVMILRSTAVSALGSRRIPAAGVDNSPGTLIDGGLRVLQPTYHSSDSLTANQSSQRWTFLGSTAICSMTGFASDIDYLTRMLQNRMDNHRFTYEGTSSSSSSPMLTLQLVQTLAERLQEACQWQNGRPYGVQALVIGHDRRSRITAAGINPAPSLRIFSLDPSGGYLHWSSGTAIGRSAVNVRKQLYDCLRTSKKESGTIDARNALEVGLRASLQARREESAHLEPSDRYEALLLWEDGEHLCIAPIDAVQIDELRETIVKELEGDKGKSSLPSS